MCRIIFDRFGVSYSISAVIATSTTIVLVLVASTYAYQVLEQQRAGAEFTAAKKAILTFDDAVRTVAWDLKSIFSTRFTIQYGRLRLISNTDPKEAQTLTVSASVGGDTANYSTSVGLIRYCIEDRYVNLGDGYQSYILGDENLIVANPSDCGRAFIEQRSNWINITLNYSVWTLVTSPINVTENEQEVSVSYVNVFIIKILVDAENSIEYVGDFDLKATCVNVHTQSSEDFDSPGENCTIGVQLGSESDSADISLYPGTDKVVVNFVVSEVNVTV